MLRCSVLWAITKRNLKSYFSGALGFLFITAFVFFDAFLTYTPEFFTTNIATLEQLTRNMPLLLLFFVPAITMSVWADERKQGTDELLFTMPATDVEILLGKYLAVLAVYTIALLFTLTKIIGFALLAGPDPWVVATTYLGYWLAGAALLGAGMFASAIIPNATAAFVLGVLVCAVPVFVDLLPLTGEIGRSLSIGHHLEEFGKGLIPLSGLLYFGSLIGFTLYLNHVLITRRHWGAGSTNMGLHHAVRVVALFVALVCVNNALRSESEITNLRVDATAERIHTLSSETRTILAEIPEQTPVVVEAFVSSDLPREHVLQAKSLRNLLRQYDRLAGDLLSVNVVDTQPHTAEADAAEKWDVQPRTVQHQDTTGQRTSDVFLGAVVRSPRGQVVIPFFEEALSVEHELTRAIAAVTEREKLKIGILSTDAPVMGGQGMPRMTIVEFLEEFYDVEQVSASSEIAQERTVEFALLDAREDEFRKQHAELVEARLSREKEEREKAENEAETEDSKPESDDDRAAGDEAADDAEEEETGPETDKKPEPDANESEEEEPLPDVEEYVASELKKYREDTPRSEYLVDDPTESLDEESLSDDLRQRFQWRNVRFSNEANVEVVTKGEKWTIRDVNPVKEYTVGKKDGEIVLTMPRYDVLIAVLPSTLDASSMKNLVDYVKTGAPVLIFDDPLPFHLGPYFAADMSPSRPKRTPQRTPMAPPETPEKADNGTAKSLLDALGISWEYDEIVWDEYDPHPKFRRFPTGGPLDPKLTYVGAGNGTTNALDGETAAGLRELLFIYPGRIKQIEGSKFGYQSLLRAGNQSGIYEWDDVVETERPRFVFPGGPTGDQIVGINATPKQTVVMTETDEGEKRVSHFVLAAHITSAKPKDGDDEKESSSKADERNVIFVADADMIGWIPMFALVNEGLRESEDIDFTIDNRTFVLNAIDVLGGRGDLVGLRKRRPRVRSLKEIERRKQQLEKDKSELIRAAREEEESQIEKSRESIQEKQREIAESEGLTRTQQFQENVNVLYSEGKNLERKLESIRDSTEEKIDGYEAEYRRKVADLHEEVRIRSIALPVLPPLLLWIITSIARFTRERSQVDPRRARH